MKKEQYDRNQLEQAEADDAERLRLIKTVSRMIAEGDSAANIVSVVIGALTPDDGEECPVCGICP